MYLDNWSLMYLILKQALQAPAHKARKTKWQELRESWAWKPWLLRWHCLLYERWRWSCHRRSCESAKGWSHWWLSGRSLQPRQPLIQQSWTHPLRCITLECQPFATKRVCRNPCGHGWVYMGAKLGQRQVGNFQSWDNTLGFTAVTKTTQYPTRPRDKNVRKTRTKVRHYPHVAGTVRWTPVQPGFAWRIGCDIPLGRRLSACTMRWWLWKKGTWKRLYSSTKILLVKYVHKFTH